MSAVFVSGVLYYPGVLAPQYAVINRVNGVRPTPCLLYAQPQPGTPNTTGNATFRFGSTTQSLTMTNVLCESATLRMTQRGFQQIFVLWDRRWKWSRAEPVIGAYNLRNPDGTYQTSTQKTVQELAEILFTAIGEPGADLSAITSDEYPEVAWDSVSAPDALDDLLTQRGYVVSLLWDDTVKVYQRGTGAVLPNSDDIVNVSVSIDPPEIPETLRCIMNKTMVQSMLKMVPVGLDTDGQIKKVADLSYNPGGVGNASGWLNRDLYSFNYITDPVARDAAVKSVGKWFQVESQADGTQNIQFGDVDYVPGEITVDDGSQLCPLRPYLLTAGLDQFNVSQYDAAFVSGTFYIDPATAAANQPPQKPGNTDPFTRLDRRDWDLNQERGILVFTEPAIKKDGNDFTFADVYFTCSYSIHPMDTMVKDRLYQDKALGGTGMVFSKLEELQRQLIVAYTAGTSTVNGITDNQNAMKTEADEYLDKAAYDFTTEIATVLFYRDVHQYNTDGIAWQVQILVGSPGSVPFATRVSQNAEMLPLLPTEEYLEGLRLRNQNGSPTQANNNHYKSQMRGKSAPGGGWGVGF